MSLKDKPLVWLYGEVRTPPMASDARIQAGYLLRLLKKRRETKKDSGVMTVRADKRNKLKAAGWKIGSAADLLELNPEEEALIEVKLRLSETLKIVRERKNLSQQQLAEIIGSSQSRVAKMEAGDPSVTMDLLVKSIFAMGASKAVVARAVAGGKSS